MLTVKFFNSFASLPKTAFLLTLSNRSACSSVSIPDSLISILSSLSFTTAESAVLTGPPFAVAVKASIPSSCNSSISGNKSSIRPHLLFLSISFTANLLKFITGIPLIPFFEKIISPSSEYIIFFTFFEYREHLHLSLTPSIFFRYL